MKPATRNRPRKTPSSLSSLQLFGVLLVIWCLLLLGIHLPYYHQYENLPQLDSLSNKAKTILIKGSQALLPLSSSEASSRSNVTAVRYETSVVCPGCRHTEVRVKRRVTFCGKLYEDQSFVQLNNSRQQQLHSQEDSSWQVLSLDQYAACHAPCACVLNTKQQSNSTQETTKKSYKYWRYDKTLPPLIQAKSFFLPSISQSARAPNNVQALQTFDFVQYMKEKWANGRQYDLWFEFNPTVVILPPSLQRRAQQEFPTAVYLASFRVGGEQNCFPWHGIKEHWDSAQYAKLSQTNHLGLALLDEQLDMIPGTDFVVDLQTPLLGKYKFSNKKALSVIDFRLYVLHETIYLNINGPPVFIVPIDLYFASNDDDNNNDDGSHIKPRLLSNFTMSELWENHKRGSQKDHILLDNLYDHGHGKKPKIQLVLQDIPSVLSSVEENGKNYAMFVVNKTTVLAELNIANPRTLRAINLTASPERLARCEIYHLKSKGHFGCANATQAKKDEPIQKTISTGIQRRRVHRVITLTDDDHDPPPPSFATLDELWFASPVFDRFSHGGACCVSLSYQEKDLIVGVGHHKVAYRTWMSQPEKSEQRLQQPSHQYASFFYAFDARHPLQLVAQSGMFCMPFASDQETNEVNAYNSLAEWDQLRFRGQTFDCPKISFVSDLNEHATNPNWAIVSYGINDCTSRMVVIDKSHIARLLFEGMVE